MASQPAQQIILNFTAPEAVVHAMPSRKPRTAPVAEKTKTRHTKKRPPANGQVKKPRLPRDADVSPAPPRKRPVSSAGKPAAAPTEKRDKPKKTARKPLVSPSGKAAELRPKKRKPEPKPVQRRDADSDVVYEEDNGDDE